MPRSALETIDKVLAVIPDGEEVKTELQAYRDSVFIELPEANRPIWAKAGQILHRYLADNEETWAKRAEAIWLDKTVIVPVATLLAIRTLCETEGGELAGKVLVVINQVEK